MQPLSTLGYCELKRLLSKNSLMQHFSKTNNFCGNHQSGARVYFHVVILYIVVEYPCEAKHCDLTPNRKKIILHKETLQICSQEDNYLK